MRHPGAYSEQFVQLRVQSRSANCHTHSTNTHLRTRSVQHRPSTNCDLSTPLTSPHAQRDWSALYAPGDEIQAHLQDVVDKYKLARHIKLSHEVVRAQWDAPAGKWRVRVRRPDPATGELGEIDDVADVLVTAFGPISRWRMPDIEGIGEFGGELHHTAGYKPAPGKTWRDDLGRWKDKKVGVVGSVRRRVFAASAGVGLTGWGMGCRARRRSRW